MTCAVTVSEVREGTTKKRGRENNDEKESGEKGSQAGEREAVDERRPRRDWQAGLS